MSTTEQKIPCKLCGKCNTRHWQQLDGRLVLCCKSCASRYHKRLDKQVCCVAPKTKPKKNKRKKRKGKRRKKCRYCYQDFLGYPAYKYCDGVCRDMDKRTGYTERVVQPEREKRLAAEQRRLDRINNAPGRGVTKADRLRVLKLYEKCLRCGSADVCANGLDHVIPLFKGGRHDPDNLQPLCWPCNKFKGIRCYDYRPFPCPPAR